MKVGSRGLIIFIGSSKANLKVASNLNSEGL